MAIKRERIVCSMDQAKQLQQCGINQLVSLFYWDLDDRELYSCADGSAAFMGCVAAFTVAELGVMLPGHYLTMGTSISDTQTRVFHTGYWDIKNIDTDDDYDVRDSVSWDIESGNERFQYEAHARAALLIHLLQHQLTTAAEVNARLLNYH